jgi:drug/metabolite transporter (DMT)-like permease
VPSTKIAKIANVTKVQKQGLAFAFLGVFLFSASLPLTKLALQSFDPFFTAFARPLIALTIALPLMLRAKALRLPRELWKPVLFTTFGAVFGWPILIALALQRSTSTHIAVIAAVMPLVTALIAVLKFRKHVGIQFWIASCVGTLLLILFAVSRGGAKGESLSADILTIFAVIFSSICYVEGAGLTKRMPGWQVISWVVIVGSPLSVIGAVTIFLHTRENHLIHLNAVLGLLGIGFSSMYLAFFAWYRGLNDLGVEHGSQVQQLQAIMTLGWSALLLRERVTFTTILTACGIVLCVLWALTTTRAD